ncbi:hypothetical protein A2U01_0102313, partial [Trifolium medium]|nr:hypothetical protein [Trifolium medium]
MASTPVPYSLLTGYRRAGAIMQCICDLLQHEVQFLPEAPDMVDHFHELMADFKEYAA